MSDVATLEHITAVAKENNYLANFKEDKMVYGLEFVYPVGDWNIAEFELSSINFLNPFSLYFNKEGAIQMRKVYRKYVNE